MKISPVAAVGPLLLLAGRRSAAVPCASSTLVAPSVVEDTAGALRLAEAVDCSDGTFEVSWVGTVAMEQTIRVPDGTFLSIVGLPDGSSTVDGAGEVGLFEVNGGALQLSGLSLVNGTSAVGGSIFASDSVVSVTECVFTGNAASQGGAIYALDSVVNATDCVFTRNVADGSGGAYFGWNSLLQSDKCEFSDNSANFGGAIDLYTGSLFHASESVFSKNNASRNGGGVQSGSSEMNADNCSFSYNSADNGGAMSAYNTSVIHASGSIFTHNIAPDYGGSVHVDTSVLTLAGCNLSQNSADIGGAVFGSRSEVNVSGNSVFEDNIAGTSGGGVFLQSGSHLAFPVHDGGALFSGNHVEGAGAGVYVTTDSTVSLEGPTVFTNNSAGGEGGGMYVVAVNDFRVENATFSFNSAQTNGGAMSLVSVGTAEANGEYAQILNSSFGENEAGNTGGAVYIAGGFVEFNRSDFEGNTAGAGGALYAAGTAKLNDCVLSKNRAALGSAVSSVVSFVLQDSDFRDNALLCDDDRFFLDWTHVSAYDIACDQCDECEGCTMMNPDKALLCEGAFPNTDSRTPDGTLESLYLAPGYWRSSDKSRDIRDCPRARSCPGGTEGRCAVGYDGTFCAECAEDYSLGLGYTCSECDEDRRKWTTAVAVVLLVAAAVAVTVSVGYLGASTKESAAARIPSLVRERFGRSWVSQGFKIIIVSWQIVSQFASVASVTYPDLYATFVGFIDFLDLDVAWTLSVDCWVGTNFYVTLLTMTIGPVVVSVLVLGSWWIRTRHCPADDPDRFSRINQRHAKFMYLISFLVYSSVSSTVFQTFPCDDIDTGESFLRVDYRIQCSTAEHRGYMVYAGFMCLVYPIGIPVAYLFFLYKARKGFKSEEEAMRTDIAVLRPLWQPYRQSVYYYEVVECFRRVTLSGLVIFILPNTAGQVMTGFLLSVAFFALFTVLDPYAHRRDTWLARIGHAIVMMSLFVAMAVKVDVTADDGFSQDVFAGALVAANVVLALIVAVEALWMCSDVVQEIREV
ncbi:unnamed protein product [Ectocarpus sp. 6 AP-2014]